jgi:hypothetical protein
MGRGLPGDGQNRRGERIGGQRASSDARAGRTSRRPNASASRAAASRATGSAALQQVAWLADDQMPLEDWIAAGRKLGVLGRSSQWWLGDWIRFGNARWGERYREAARITGYDIGSLRNMAWIAGQFDLDLRHPKLSWSHYPLLAKLPSDERASWIERAVDDRLTVADLRIELRRRTGTSPTHVADRERSHERRGISCPHCGEWISGPLPLDAGGRPS